MNILKANDIGYYCFVKNTEIFLENDTLLFGYAKDYGFVGEHAIYIGKYNNNNVWLVCNNALCPTDQFISLRSLLNKDAELFGLLSKSVELKHFLVTNKFCGLCSGKNDFNSSNVSLTCVACNKVTFPVICPSIIVAVRKEDKILLANHIRHQKEKLYTVLAGFIEIGETAEQAVHREVYEETKIQIKNIRYISSQAWAFPNSLMLAFMADYDGGEISVQKQELQDARWFHYDEELPILAPHGTIARKLIDDTLVLCSKKM